MKKYVRFKQTPKVKRIITVSFTVGGKRITFQKTQKVRKRIGIRFHSRRRRIHSSNEEADKP